PIVQAQHRPGDPPVRPATTEGERPKGPGDATPRQAVIPGGAGPNRGDPATTLPPHVVTALRQQFGAQLDRLPPAELAAFARAYNGFTAAGTERRDAAPFLQAFGRALVADRRRMVGEMAANPTEQLARLAPALERQAGLMRIAEAADFVHRDGDRAFTVMRNSVLTNPATVERARLITREQLNTPEGWRAFRALYGEAAGPYALNVASLNRNPSHPRFVIARFDAAMAELTRPGADGTAPLQRASPQDIATAATRNLVALGREHPQLQAFTAAQVRDMADGMRPPGTEQRFTMAAGDPPTLRQEITGPNGLDLMAPAEGSPAFTAYREHVRATLGNANVPVDNSQYYSGILMRPPVAERTSALAVFRAGVQSTNAGLAVAEERLRTNTMSASDLLPLARQVQGHLALEAAGTTGGEPNPALVPAVMDLGTEIRRAEEQAQRERNVRLGTAAVGVVTGVGLLASGPLGWGVGLTTALAVGAGASAVATIALDSNEFATRLRAGGLDHAGLVLSAIERESIAGFAGSTVLNAAGALSGIPSVLTAQRLVYARNLTTAMRTEGEAPRAAAITEFLHSNKIMTREAWTALAPERQMTALRLMERFGSEVSPQAMQAILRFGAVEAEISNASGAVSNVDHMYAAYVEMNRAEAIARGRSLTERERILNAVATVGTDAQGKFGHASLPIIPTRVGDRVLRTPAEHLQEVRRRAVDDAFAGLENAQGVDQAVLRGYRDRFMRDIVPMQDGQARNAALGSLVREIEAGNPQAAQWVRRHLSDTELLARLSPFTEGAYIHNVVDPGRIFTMGRAAGLSEAESAEAAYRATMHGFGNAFVASAYPGMPTFASVMRPGTSTRLFSDTQLRSLQDVGEASLAWNQRIEVPPHLAARWNLPTDPPPRGARQIFSSALRANGGELPPGMDDWLIAQGRVFVDARRRAGLGAGATNADNLGNFVAEGMRKWAGIFGVNPGTPAAQRTVGHQVLRMMSGLNGYAIEERAIGNLVRFDHNFGGPARRVGLYLPENSSTYRWVMREQEGRIVLADLPEAGRARQMALEARRSSADAIRQRFPGMRGSDDAVLTAFYGQSQENAAALALAELAEGTLPAAFSSAAALRNARNFDPRLQMITQMILYQQGIGQGVRLYDR
ncbi:MAG: hypothetical protein ACAI38_11145, partial [Myxococcota bacterium]